MINLRYHIVSIVAVFLALGIGLALGSTFISGAVVSRLEDDIADLDGEVDTLRAERDEARAELDTLQSEQQLFEEQALPIIGGGRLAGHRALVITSAGVGDDLLDPLEIGLAGSEAEFVGTLRFTEALDLSDEENRRRLAELLGLPEDGSEAVLRRSLEVQLAAALAPDEPPDAGATLGEVLSGVAEDLFADDDLTVTPPEETPRPPLIGQLIAEGFLDYDDEIVNRRVLADDLVVPGTRYAFVSDEDARVPDDELMIPLIRTLAETELEVPGVAAGSSVELDGDEPDFVEQIRDDSVLVNRISTIDDLDAFPGLLATLTALDQLSVVGHYGVGEDAQALLPGPQ